MAVSLSGISVENFKSYDEPQWIDLSDLSILMGANSSGKSTALQTLLILKQTIECNSPEIDLLLSGKFVTLGDFRDVVNDISKNYIKIGVSLNLQNELENCSDKKENKIFWKFKKEGPETGRILLAEIEFYVNGYDVRLIRDNTCRYAIYINEIKTQLLVELHNLKIRKMYIEYDEEINVLFHQFLNELLICLIQKKKITSLEKDEIMAIFGSERFFYLISRDIQVMSEKETIGSKAINLGGKVLDLIEEYSKTEYKECMKFDSLPRSIKKRVLTIAIHNLMLSSDGEDRVCSLIDKYDNLLQEYKNHSTGGIEKRYSKLNMNYTSMQNDIREVRESELERIASIFITYRQFLQEGLGKLFYIGPLREKPLGLYNIGFEAVPRYVGTTGAYFASVLLYENREKEYLLPNDETEETSLWEALDTWALHLNVASEIHVEQRNSFGFSVSVANTQNKKSDIMNVGIGTSQVLPVLVAGLLSEPNETLIFEQPELHLHPFSQSRLADFFVSLAKNGRRVIVETHSEYMILRMRYHVLTGHVHEDQISINFFQNRYGTKVKQGILNSYGNLEYPSDFKDETQELLNELMNAALVKGRQNEKESVD